jgi:hypothetical protein
LEEEEEGGEGKEEEEGKEEKEEEKGKEEEEEKGGEEKEEEEEEEEHKELLRISPTFVLEEGVIEECDKGSVSGGAPKSKDGNDSFATDGESNTLSDVDGALINRI